MGTIKRDPTIMAFSLIMVLTILISILPFAASAATGKTDVPGKIYEFDKDSHYEFADSERYFDVQTLDLEEPNPQWKIMTAEEWMRSEQGSRRPLAEQAEEIHPRKIDEEE